LTQVLRQLCRSTGEWRRRCATARPRRRSRSRPRNPTGLCPPFRCWPGHVRLRPPLPRQQPWIGADDMVDGEQVGVSESIDSLHVGSHRPAIAADLRLRENDPNPHQTIQSERAPKSSASAAIPRVGSTDLSKRAALQLKSRRTRGMYQRRATSSSMCNSCWVSVGRAQRCLPPNNP
jgi:hypothetical protein